MVYRQPDSYEAYRMRVLGFASLQAMEEWMNNPAPEEANWMHENPWEPDPDADVIPEEDSLDSET